jgi:hypothetical protein
MFSARSWDPDVIMLKLNHEGMVVIIGQHRGLHAAANLPAVDRCRCSNPG